MALTIPGSVREDFAREAYGLSAGAVFRMAERVAGAVVSGDLLTRAPEVGERYVLTAWRRLDCVENRAHLVVPASAFVAVERNLGRIDVKTGGSALVRGFGGNVTVQVVGSGEEAGSGSTFVIREAGGRFVPERVPNGIERSESGEASFYSKRGDRVEITPNGVFFIAARAR